MLSKIILIVYNLFSILAWTTVLCLVILAAFKADSWRAWGDTYTEESLMRKTLMIAQGVNVLDIVFGFLGWTKNGVAAPILQNSGRIYIVFMVLPFVPKCTEAETWIGQ